MLKLTDRFGQRRLGHVAGRRGARVIALAGERDEVAKVPDIHVRMH